MTSNDKWTCLYPSPSMYTIRYICNCAASRILSRTRTNDVNSIYYCFLLRFYILNWMHSTIAFDMTHNYSEE